MEAGLLQHTFCLLITGELYPSVESFGRVSRSMRRTSINVVALPKRKADFIEPMDCAPVTKLLDGPEWVYEMPESGQRPTEGCEREWPRMNQKGPIQPSLLDSAKVDGPAACKK